MANSDYAKSMLSITLHIFNIIPYTNRNSSAKLYRQAPNHTEWQTSPKILSEIELMWQQWVWANKLNCFHDFDVCYNGHQ